MMKTVLIPSTSLMTSFGAHTAILWYSRYVFSKKLSKKVGQLRLNICRWDNWWLSSVVLNCLSISCPSAQLTRPPNLMPKSASSINNLSLIFVSQADEFQDNISRNMSWKGFSSLQVFDVLLCLCQRDFSANVRKCHIV